MPLVHPGTTGSYPGDCELSGLRLEGRGPPSPKARRGLASPRTRLRFLTRRALHQRCPTSSCRNARRGECGELRELPDPRPSSRRSSTFASLAATAARRSCRRVTFIRRCRRLRPRCRPLHRPEVAVARPPEFRTIPRRPAISLKRWWLTLPSCRSSVRRPKGRRLVCPRLAVMKDAELHVSVCPDR
jgi:hypothetical protein